MKKLNFAFKIFVGAGVWMACQGGDGFAAAPNLIFPDNYSYTQQDLREMDVIRSTNGVLEAHADMVSAGFGVDPIFYGGEEIYSNPDTNGPYYAMAYQWEAYGTNYSAGFPGTMLQLQPGDTLKIQLHNELAGTNDPSDSIFTSNFHYHGSHAPCLSQADNIYVQLHPHPYHPHTMEVVIPVERYENSVGLNWYHPHVHEVSKWQVQGGLAGFIMVGDPLDAWPQYKGQLREIAMAFSEVNLQSNKMAALSSSDYGTNATAGWQKRINGQMNPIIRIRPNEAQVWNMGMLSARGAICPIIADENLAHPWTATIIARDGNSAFVHPYTGTLGPDLIRISDIASQSLLGTGNRMSLVVQAPTNTGTFYLIDGWGGEEAPARDYSNNGSPLYYVLATIVVEGDPVTNALPVFTNQVEDPLWSAIPDVKTFFSLQQGGNDINGDSGIDNFYINGKKFGQGVMPQLEIGTVQEWTILNAGPLNHPFHIHQGNFIVTQVGGFPVYPSLDNLPFFNAVNYVSPLDVIMVPAFSSVTVRFRVQNYPGKYVWHCHILEHEDEGMMSPVFQYGGRDGKRLALATAADRGTLVLNGQGDSLATLRPFPGFPVVAASGIGTDTNGIQLPNPLPANADEANALYKTLTVKDTMAIGTGAGKSWVKIYTNGSLVPSASFKAFSGKAGIAGVSVAVGAVSADGSVRVAVGSRARGNAAVKLFDTSGNLIREFTNVLPGIFPHGVNVAIGDVDADNYDDIIVSAGRGREAIVTALSGRDIVEGAEDPMKCFTQTLGDPKSTEGLRVAVGYLAPSNIPSYYPNLVGTPEQGANVGTVSVWNVHDLLEDSMHAMAGVMDAYQPAEEAAPVPTLTFRPFGDLKRAVNIAATYQSLPNGPSEPVIACWWKSRETTFTSIGMNNKAQTQLRKF